MLKVLCSELLNQNPNEVEKKALNKMCFRSAGGKKGKKIFQQ